MKPCPYCAEDIQDAAVVCRFCNRDIATGALPVSSAPRSAPPSPGVAAVLSLVIPGAGQIYSGHLGAGIAWLLLTVMGYAMLIVPGIVLHLACIATAYSGASSAAPAPATYPERSHPEPRAAAPRAVVVLGWFAAAIAVLVVAVRLGSWASESVHRNEVKPASPKPADLGAIVPALRPPVDFPCASGETARYSAKYLPSDSSVRVVLHDAHPDPADNEAILRDCAVAAVRQFAPRRDVIAEIYQVRNAVSPLPLKDGSTGLIYDARAKRVMTKHQHAAARMR